MALLIPEDPHLFAQTERFSLKKTNYFEIITRLLKIFRDISGNNNGYL